MGSEYEALGPDAEGEAPPGPPPAPPPPGRAPQPLLTPGKPGGPTLVGQSARISEHTATDVEAVVPLEAEPSPGRDDKDKDKDKSVSDKLKIFSSKLDCAVIPLLLFIFIAILGCFTVMGGMVYASLFIK